MKRSSQNIKTAFILSIVAGSIIDVVAIIMMIFSSYSISIGIFNYVNAGLFLALVAAPFVMGVVALSLINNVKPATPRDKVFRILARIFSIAAIVESCLVILYFFFIIFLVFLIAGFFIISL